jgi:hypothetical protein
LQGGDHLLGVEGGARWRYQREWEKFWQEASGSPPSIDAKRMREGEKEFCRSLTPQGRSPADLLPSLGRLASKKEEGKDRNRS